MAVSSNGSWASFKVVAEQCQLTRNGGASSACRLRSTGAMAHLQP
jgi:hypothetical protein